MSKTTVKKYKWFTDGCNTELTADEVLIKLGPVFCGVMQTMNECDGDIWMSDYQKLMGLFWNLHRNDLDESSTADQCVSR